MLLSEHDEFSYFFQDVFVYWLRLIQILEQQKELIQIAIVLLIEVLHRIVEHLGQLAHRVREDRHAKEEYKRANHSLHIGNGIDIAEANRRQTCEREIQIGHDELKVGLSRQVPVRPILVKADPFVLEIILQIVHNKHEYDPRIGHEVDDEDELHEDGADLEDASEVYPLLYHVEVLVDAVAQPLIVECLLELVVDCLADDGFV